MDTSKDQSLKKQALDVQRSNKFVEKSYPLHDFKKGGP